ncbi:MAG: hypothetical protein KAJ20_03450 [Candidatus Aenigmarchaeota archaeon]|nr:hypothetical protein [Candidatus Aenigmarchaeota archaeon]MCK5042732.1 hypothetical protein [Candidatus Aenigmarchaeota archaeon]MCK5373367.1 hypothetical protein [Candidatus Aenigmarchaeota archaeon]
MKVMDRQLPPAQEDSHKDELARIKEELDSMNLGRLKSDETKAPETHVHDSQPISPFQNQAPENQVQDSQPAEPLTKKIVNPQVGPLFISLKKFNEIKAQIASLKHESGELRKIVEQLKTSRDSGTTLLRNAVNKMDTIEKNVEDINSIIKI